MSPPSELITLTLAVAARHALDSALVCAIVEQESDWNPHAIRYEAAFRAHYVAPLALPPSEEIARSISWGLMQVMGQVAREHGFTGKFLSALCEPAAGLEIGCAVFATKLALARGTKGARLETVATSHSSQSAANGALDTAPAAGASIPTQQGTDAPEIEHALQLWNGGANPNYADEVLARVANYR